MQLRLCLSLALLLLVLVLSLPSSFAWGDNAQRLITNKAMDTLPDDIRPFFESNRQFLVQHVTDPDEAEKIAFHEDALSDKDARESVEDL